MKRLSSNKCLLSWKIVLKPKIVAARAHASVYVCKCLHAFVKYKKSIMEFKLGANRAKCHLILRSNSSFVLIYTECFANIELCRWWFFFSLFLQTNFDGINNILEDIHVTHKRTQWLFIHTIIYVCKDSIAENIKMSNMWHVYVDVYH